MARWPVPIFAGLLFWAVRAMHERRAATARSWAILQIGALIVIAAFAFLALPFLLVLPMLMFAGAAQPSEPVWGLSFFAAVVLVTGLGATLGLGAAFMNIAIRPFAVQMRGPEIIEEGGKVLEPLEGGFKDAGRIIGHYERLLIFLFVLADAPTAIGFLIAAKSVFRFGDLTDTTRRKNAEYLIIGTLMSFAYALVVSYSTRFVFRFLTGG